MEEAIFAMIVVFAFVIWPFGGVWEFLSGLIGGGAQESFIYPIYGGIVLLAGLIVACAERILKEIKSLKAETKGTEENS